MRPVFHISEENNPAIETNFSVFVSMKGVFPFAPHGAPTISFNLSRIGHQLGAHFPSLPRCNPGLSYRRCADGPSGSL